MAEYSFSTVITGSVDSARQRVTDALSEQGFGVLTEIDVASTLKAKLEVDIEPYLILGACNPPFANQALAADPGIGVLLPCNVVLRQRGNDVVVEFMDPAAVLTLVDGPGIAEIAGEVRARLVAVRDSLR